MERIISQEPSWGLAFFAHEGVNCKGEVTGCCRAFQKVQTSVQISFHWYFWAVPHKEGVSNSGCCLPAASQGQCHAVYCCMLMLPGPADHLQATRTAMAQKIQYDTFITVYFSDCDYYSRVLQDGWKLVSYTDHCPGLDLKVALLRETLLCFFCMPDGIVKGIRLLCLTRCM